MTILFWLKCINKIQSHTVCNWKEEEYFNNLSRNLWIFFSTPESGHFVKLSCSVESETLSELPLLCYTKTHCYAEEVFYAYFHFFTWNIKKISQGWDLIKRNFVLSHQRHSQVILSEFFFCFKCVCDNKEHKDWQYTSKPLPWFAVKLQWFYPPLPLYLWCTICISTVKKV